MKKIRSPEYDTYERWLSMLLPKLPNFPAGSRLRIDYVFWFKTDASDVDNPIKPLQDIVSKQYWFNDNKIAYITSRKYIVSPGDEFLQIIVTELPKDFEMVMDKESIANLFKGKHIFFSDLSE